MTLKEKMSRGKIRIPTRKDLDICNPVIYHCATLTWNWIVGILVYKSSTFKEQYTFQFPGKQISFWNFFKVHMLSYWSSNTHAKLAHVDFTYKKIIELFRFSRSNSASPLDAFITGCRHSPPQRLSHRPGEKHVKRKMRAQSRMLQQHARRWTDSLCRGEWGLNVSFFCQHPDCLMWRCKVLNDNYFTLKPRQLKRNLNNSMTIFRVKGWNCFGMTIQNLRVTMCL